MIPDAAWSVLEKAGIAGIAIVVIAYLFLFVMKQQREERKEWREAHMAERSEWRIDIKTDREAANAVLKDFQNTLNSAQHNSTKT